MKKLIEVFLKIHRIRNACVRIKRGGRYLDSWRAFLCLYWHGGNLLEFRQVENGVEVLVISTRSGREDRIEKILLQQE